MLSADARARIDREIAKYPPDQKQSAVMSALVRTAIGPFRIEDAMNARSPDEARLREHLQSPLVAVPDMPRLTLTELQVYEVQHGGLIKVEHLPAEMQAGACGDGLIAGLGPPQLMPSDDVVPRIFVWYSSPETILRPASSML